MANLLDLVDSLLGSVLQGNIYSDNNTFRKNVLTPQTPEGAFGHIPNADPRNLSLIPGKGFVHPHEAITQTAATRIIPPDPMHGTQGTFGPGPLNVKNIEDHPHTDMGNIIPQNPVHGNKDGFSDGGGLVKEAARRGFYNQKTPSSITQQTKAVAGDAGNPPRNGPPLTDFTTTSSPQGVIKTDASNTFYDSPALAPQSTLASLADFHQSAIRPPTTAFTAEKRAESSNFPPKSPAKNPPSTHPGANPTVENSFAETPQRPLNFEADEGPDRRDLVASFHPQKYGPNTSNTQGAFTAQNHGILNDNRYDDSDIPFEGNFQSGFRGPIPQFLNYFNVIATGHWLRNIADELFVPDITGGFGGGSVPQPKTPDALAQPVPEGITKGLTFIASQFLLTAMNPANPENGLSNAIWNPLSIAAAIPVVGSANATNITAGAALGMGIYKDNVLTADNAGVSKLLLARDGIYSEISPIHRVSKFQSPIAQPGFIGETVGPGPGDTLDNQFTDNFPSTLSTIASQVDSDVGSDSHLGIHTNIYNAGRPYSERTAIFPFEKLHETALNKNDPGTEKLSNMFDAVSRANSSVFDQINASLGPSLSSGPAAGAITKRAPASILADWKNKSRFGQTDGITNTADAPGLGHVGVVEALVGASDNEEDGITPGTKGSGPLTADSEIYMPFIFEDLRDGGEKYLYFRAFLKGDINETFTPDWQTERFYGRVDQVPIYKGTMRSMNFTFDVAAFQPSDLDVIWRKLQKLQSMVYPTYNTRGFMESGPLIRLRIGDLFAGENRRGLPGYITGMDWSFPDGIWNIEEKRKVPRLVTVAISYTVIHDGNPGIYPLSQWTVDAAGEITEESGERTFGTGRFIENGDGSSTVKVSRAEIRKIFDTVRGTDN